MLILFISFAMTFTSGAYLDEAFAIFGQTGRIILILSTFLIFYVLVNVCFLVFPIKSGGGTSKGDTSNGNTHN